MANLHVDLYNGNDANDGSTWALAKKTVSFTAAQISAGDTIKISKTPDPISIGNADWEDGSSTVELESVRTQLITDGNTLWTKATPNDFNTNAFYWKLDTTKTKLGNASMYMRFGYTSITPSIKQAYLPLPSSLDLSSFQHLSFHSMIGGNIDNDELRICLCSDLLGETVVDEFIIPAIANQQDLTPFTLSRIGNGALGANINSIALYTTSASSIKLKNVIVYIGDVIASKINDIDLNTLISKNGLASGGTVSYQGIQSIVGTTVKIDNAPGSKTGSERPFSGTTETCETFIRQAFSIMNLISTVKAGSASSFIAYEGGYNTTSGEQDGETYCESPTAYNLAYGFYSNLAGCDYIKTERLSFFRYKYGVYILTRVSHCEYSFTDLCNNNIHGFFTDSQGSTNIVLCKNANNNGYLNTSHGICISSRNTTVNSVRNANGNFGYGIYVDNMQCSFPETIYNVNWNGLGGIYLYEQLHFINTIECIRNNGEVYTGTSQMLLENASGTIIEKITCVYLKDHRSEFISFINSIRCRLNQLDVLDGVVAGSLLYGSFSFDNVIRVNAPTDPGSLCIAKGRDATFILEDCYINNSQLSSTDYYNVKTEIILRNNRGSVPDGLYSQRNLKAYGQTEVVPDTASAAARFETSVNSVIYPELFKIADIHLEANKATIISLMVKSTVYTCFKIFKTLKVGILNDIDIYPTSSEWQKILFTFTTTDEGWIAIYLYYSANYNAANYVTNLEIVQV